MSFSSFSGPLRAGTVRQGAASNAGLVVLTQSKTLAGTVVSTAPSAQALFTLPAGAKILSFTFERTVILAGNSISACTATIGDGTTADKYLTSCSTGITVGMTDPTTVAAAFDPLDCDNIGTTDKTLYGTFTATTGTATSGSMVVTVHYVQRTAAGAVAPTTFTL